MLRAKRFCRYAGCRALTSDPSGYCDEHRYIWEDQQKRRDVRRGTAQQRGYDSRWARYSKAYLRDPRHQLCALRLDDACAIVAQCVDHIDPPDGPGDPRFWDPANHQPACIHCNSVKGHRKIIGHGTFGRDILIRIICGYPGSGKTTLARKLARNSRRGVVLDLDALAEAVAGDAGLTEADRRAMRMAINENMWPLARSLERAKLDVYMIRTAPTPTEMLEAGREVRLMLADVPPQTAYERIVRRDGLAHIHQGEFERITRRVDDFVEEYADRIERISTSDGG